MLPVLNLLSSGVVPFILGDSVVCDVVNGCQGYSGDFARGTLTAVDTADTRANNVRYTAAGLLRLYDATAALPAGASIVDGLAVSSTGQLCTTTGAPASDVTYIGGMAVRNDGAVHIADMSPAAWYRFNQGITVTGLGVSAWADKSGNARDLLQGTDTNRPAKQSDGSILFDGADNFLNAGTFTLNQPVTVYLVMKQLSWTSADYVMDGGSIDTMVLYQNTGSPQLRAYAGAFGTPNGGLALNTYGIVTYLLNGASSALQINAGTLTVENLGASNPGGFILGCNAAGGGFSNIQVKEVIIYNAAHSAAQRAAVRDYLGRL